MFPRNPTPTLRLATVILALLLTTMPIAGAAGAAIGQDETDPAPGGGPGNVASGLLPLAQSSADGPAPGTRTEADGSLTILGSIMDEPGVMERSPVPLQRIFDMLRSQGIEVPSVEDDIPEAGGIFARTWTDGLHEVVTIGIYLVTDGATLNLNLVALEGTQGIGALVLEVAAHDVVPITLNVMPYVVNSVHPTSQVLFVGLLLGILAAGAVAGVLVDAGEDELAAMLVYNYVFAIFLPITFNHQGYPYHVDHTGREVYADAEDMYLWRGVARLDGHGLWDGTYIERSGNHEEQSFQTDSSAGSDAEAWKRVVVGPVVRVDEETTKLPGVYVRQDVSRHMESTATEEHFEAEATVTAGVYHRSTGESPGASVRFQEDKHGQPGERFYVDEHSDRIDVGVTSDQGFTPLVGVHTSSWHRPYTDTTNLGDQVSATESYRVTGVGVHIDGAFVPVWGVDHWTERFPLDLWALRFAAGGPGDQTVGDLMVRTGTFVDGRFVAVAGARYDDDFAGNRYDYRGMLSAGLFVTDPTDPGDPVPGQSPDGATYVPMVAVAYDGAQPFADWATANVGNSPGGMGPWMWSAGLGGPDLYAPLVGVEFLPEAHRGHRSAQETYRVGVFPGMYDLFVPVLGVSWDGDGTTVAWSAAHAQGAAGLGSPAGQADLAAGTYGPDGQAIPAVGLQYRPHNDGFRINLGVYEPAGAYRPVAEMRVYPQGGGHVTEAGTYGVDGEYQPVAGLQHDPTPPSSHTGGHRATLSLAQPGGFDPLVTVQVGTRNLPSPNIIILDDCYATVVVVVHPAGTGAQVPCS